MTKYGGEFLANHGKEGSLVVRCRPGLIDELSDQVMGGYRRYPWGGVEVGGILFGKKEADGIQISGHRAIECEHLQGPSFELSPRDLDSLESLIARVAVEDFQNQFVPVGWYHSVSRRDLCLTEHDIATQNRFFPELWQVAMILKRSKIEPVEIGVFFREAQGSIARYSLSRISVDDDPPEQTEPLFPEPPTPSEEPEGSRALPIGPISISEPELAESVSHAPAPPHNFFGLSQDPFTLVPDPRFYYASAQHEEALANLLYGVRCRKGFLSLIGGAGTGKTLVLERLMDQLKSQLVELAFLLNSKITTGEFFELLAHDLDLQSSHATKTSVLIALNERLVRSSQAGRTTVLIVDNAEKLAVDVIEEMALLGNLENRDGKLLQVVFAAQPGFERHIEEPRLRGLRQCIQLRGRLTPLSAAETVRYVESRLAKAGLAEQSIFSAEVLAEVHAQTHGIPRLINALCGCLLERCAVSRRMSVSSGMVDSTCTSINLEPLGFDAMNTVSV